MEAPSLLSDAVDGVGHTGFGGPFDDSLETYGLAGEDVLALVIPESYSAYRVFSHLPVQHYHVLTQETD